MTPADKSSLYEDKKFLDSLRKVAPGAMLREGLSYIIQAGTGGLIVVSNSPKARALLGYNPVTQPREGLAAQVAWYRDVVAATLG